MEEGPRWGSCPLQVTRGESQTGGWGIQGKEQPPGEGHLFSLQSATSKDSWFLLCLWVPTLVMRIIIVIFPPPGETAFTLTFGELLPKLLGHLGSGAPPTHGLGSTPSGPVFSMVLSPLLWTL